MDAELQMAIVDYEDAQTYALGSAERNKLLDRALAAFEGLYRRYREQMAGLHARMLQGKCFEEKGELGPAMGIYNELMDHPHPRLSDLQRFVAYYRIIVSYKRKEFALATDDALRWLQAYSRFRVTEEGLGVQLYLAKSLLAQLEAMPENDRESATRRAVEAVSEVSKYYSPHKAEALELLAKYKPKSALNLNQIANLVYDDAMNQARQAIDGQDWDRALALLRQAVLKADPRRDAEKANRARYYMAYTYLQSGRPYPAAALAEHIARRYPEGGLAAKAAEIGLVAHTQAYNTYSSHDRVSDLERLISLADYIVATWPDTVEGDTARATLGEIHIGRGHYEEAAKAFEGVRANSPRRLDAEVKAGDAHWRASQRLRDAGKNDEAEAESKRALELVQAALEARKKALTPPTDPSWIKNVNALAEIHRASGRPKDALGLLEPLAQTLQNASAGATAEIAPLREAVLILLTQTHLLDGQHERAIADMKALENLGADKAKLTQLYYQLSRRLQDEMKALDARNDRIGYQRMSQAYRQFLQALVGSEAGQSFDSLAFAGDALLTLSAAAEAEKVFDKILSAYENDAEFLKQPQADARILRVRLAKARSVREQSHFDEAHKLIVALAEQNPRLLEAQLELGLVLEDQARAENARNRWEVSYNHWRKLSEALARARPRRPEYYDAVYHVAEAQNGMGDRTRAVKTLKGAMALSPTLGSPENKAKYDALLARLGGS
jgi:tetratricopeptide (TPR) repeat protein